MTFIIIFACVGNEFGTNIVNQPKGSQQHKVRIAGADANVNDFRKYFFYFFYAALQGDDLKYVECISSRIYGHYIYLFLLKAIEETALLKKLDSYHIQTTALDVISHELSLDNDRQEIKTTNEIIDPPRLFPHMAESRTNAQRKIFNELGGNTAKLKQSTCNSLKVK